MRTIIIGIIALVSGIIAALGWSFTQKQEVVAPTQTEPTKPSPILPAILEAKNMKVTTPTPQATINSPVTLIGEARTFESNVQYRIKDAVGTIIGSGFGTAKTEEVGTFGPFSIEATFTAPTTETGYVEVYDTSAKDGSEIDLIRIPVSF